MCSLFLQQFVGKNLLLIVVETNGFLLDENKIIFVKLLSFLIIGAQCGTGVTHWAPVIFTHIV